MSFEETSLKDLKVVAEFYGVETDGLKNSKRAYIDAIEADGVEYDDAWNQVLKPEDEEDDETTESEPEFFPAQASARVTAPAGTTILVKMERKNARYDVEANGRLYTFTRDNPYALLPENDVDVILDREEGFRIASPREVREFYG